MVRALSVIMRISLTVSAEAPVTESASRWATATTTLPATPRSLAATRRRLTVTAVVLALVTIAGIAVLWPRDDVRGEVEKLGLIKHVHEAKVVSVLKGPCRGTQGGTQRVICTKIKFRLTQGPNAGETRTIEFATSTTTPQLEPGDSVVLNHVEKAEPPFDYTYSDRQRRPVLLWLTILFAVVVIALGRLRGLGALVGLGASLLVILVFMLPSMLDGNSPPLVAIVGASAVAYLALYLANGIRPMTTVALLSTLASLAITVGLATLFTNLAHFTGAANEDALLVGLGTSAIDLKGLVLAGMVLGALGALDDITVTQASAVGELRTAQPELSRCRPLPVRAPDRPRPHRVDGEHARAGLRRGLVAAAPPVHALGTKPRERRQRRDRRGRDRVGARRQHRARGRGPDLHVVRGAGRHRTFARPSRAGGRACEPRPQDQRSIATPHSHESLTTSGRRSARAPRRPRLLAISGVLAA